MSLAGPIEMLALLKKVAADVMACEKGVDAKKKAEAVCQKILDMLDDVEKAGKVCLEGSIEKEKTTAVLAVVSQLKELVKSHLPMILCPPPFVSQVLSRLAGMFSGCLSKSSVSALSPVRAALPSAVRAALPSQMQPAPPVISASPLSSDVAAVEARLAVRDPLPASAPSGEEADPAPAAATAEAAEAVK
jgi:hypothetical protein